MTRDDVRLLYEYDRWANGRILKLVEQLTPEQFARDLGGAYPAVRDVLLHMMAAKWAWLTYWKEASPSEPVLMGLFTRGTALFPREDCPTLEALRPNWVEVEADHLKFVNEVTDERLGRRFPVGDTSLSLAHLIQHLANHSTYHRGQIAMMLRQLGAKARGTDFAEFLLAAAAGRS